MQIRLACSTVKRVVVSNRNKQIQRGLDIPTLSVFRKKESNMRGCLQHDENDCGLACILTICKFLKICVDETALRKNIFLGNDGLSLYGITEVFRTIGMKSLAVEGTNIELYSLLSEEKKPIIIMINEDDEYHYVVLYKTNNSKVFLWDPNKGKRIITKEYFDLIWSSYAIIITEILEIDRVVLPKKSVCWTALFQQKKLLALLVIFSVILMAISVITTFLYKNIIDQIEIGIPTFTPQLKSFFIVMGGCYLLVSILSIVKGKLIAYLKMELEIFLFKKRTIIQVEVFWIDIIDYL